MAGHAIMVSTLDVIVVAMQSSEKSNGGRVIRLCSSLKEMRLGSEAWLNKDRFGSD
jgi:hypothetical protein